MGCVPGDGGRLPAEGSASREVRHGQGHRLHQDRRTGGLVEVTRLGRPLAKRAGDILAYFDRPGISNGPTEAINGRLEHLRGSALGSKESGELRGPESAGGWWVQAEATRWIAMSRHSPRAASGTVGGGQLVGDLAGKPLVLWSPRLDNLRDPCGQGRTVVPRAMERSTDPVLAVGAVAGNHVLRGERAMWNSATWATRRVCSSTWMTARCLPSTVRGAFPWVMERASAPDDGCLDTTHRTGRGPVLSSPRRRPQRHDP